MAGSRSISITLFHFLLGWMSVLSFESFGQTMGYTEVNATIGENGNAVVSIPLNIPKGTILQPNISLTYSSQGMDGLAGIGWNIGGVFQTITRIPATAAQDGFFDPVDFDDLDKFALNGERLILISGTYGGNNAEYRTEQNSFTKIISYGNTGYGPAGFRAWTKDGLTMDFGFSSDWTVEASGTSNKPIAWLISRIYDTNGNFMTYQYEENNSTGDYRPRAIYYTGRYAIDGNGNTTIIRNTYNTIWFDYEDRPDANIKFLAGHQSTFSKRLLAIRILDNTESYRRYKLEYASIDDTNASRLSRVTEFGTDNLTALKSVNINWTHNPFEGYGNAKTSWNSYGPSESTDNYRTGDFNGDGFTDVIRFNEEASSTWVVGLSTGQNFSNSLWSGHNAGMENTVFGDFNGDGKTDLAGYVGKGQNENWVICMSTASGFSNSTWPAHKNGVSNTVGADFNGDGRTDLAVHTSGSTWEIYLSTGASFEKQIWNATNAPLDRIQIGDFNGDGRADIAGYYNRNWEICLSTGSSFDRQIWEGIEVMENNPSKQVKIGDFNGDGLSDLIVFNSGAKAQISFSTGSSFVSEYWYLQTSKQEENKPWYIGDFNGDGLADWAQENQENYFYLSTGKNFKEQRFEGNRNNSNALPLQYNDLILADFNGDGVTDFARTTGSTWGVFLSKSAKNLLSSVINGNGVIQSFDYAPLTDATVYTRGTDAVYPSVDFSDPFFVVKRFSSDDGIGGKNTVQVLYEDIKYDLSGRGLRGFKKTTHINQLNNSKIITNYNRDYRYVGSNVAYVEHRTADGKLLKTVSNQSALNSLDNKIFFSYHSRTNETSYELDGSEISQKNTQFEFDDTGNAIKIIESESNEYKITTVNTYNNNLTKWHLGRLAEAVVTKVLADKPPTVKNSKFEYDVNGNLVKEILLPNHATRELITSYTLDESGNRVTVTQSGPGIATRSDYNTYDVLGRNVISTRNALGHTQSFSYTHNLLSSTTDPNGRITRVTRDVFGRELRTDNPDGTWETLSYVNCGASNCPTKALFFIEKDESGKGKTRSYYDILNREVRSEATGFNDVKILVDKSFNADGTVNTLTDPFYSGGSTRLTTMQYDEVKRVIKETRPGNRITQYQYNGLKNTVVNAENQKATQFHSPQGKLLQSTNHQGVSVFYDYDSDLNQTDVKNPAGEIIKVAYDIRGFRLSLTDKNIGGTTNYEYNTLGNITAQIDPKGQRTTFEYDILNRLVGRTELEGVTQWKYDPINAVGATHQILFNGNVSDTYTYDTKGNLSQFTPVRNGVDKPFKYTYESTTGLLQTITYPNDYKVRNVYLNGYLSQVVDETTNVSLWKANDYSEDGKLSIFTLGNNLKTTRTYQITTGFLSSIQTGSTSNPQSTQNLQFTFSDLGNLTERRDLLKNLTETFDYDNLNRLTNTHVAGQLPLTTSYDNLGNITYKSDVGTYRYNEGGVGSQILTSIDHSSAPNCVYEFKYQTISTSYNYISRIFNNVTEVNIAYAPGRERVSLKVRKNNVLVMQKTYAGNLYEETIDQQGKITTTCIIKAGEEVVAYRSDNGTTSKFTYLHTDHLGSVVSVSNQAGAFLEQYSYDAWGKQRNPLSWAPYTTPPNLPSQQRGFTFHEMLDVEWLICMNARVYNPVLGRFLSADPFVQFPEDLQGLNRFSYVHNNPLSFTDPSGFFLKGLGRFLKRNLGTIVGFAIAVGTGGMGAPLWLSGAAAGFGQSFTNALVSGDGIGGAFKLGLQGAIWGGINAGITNVIGHHMGFDPKNFAHNVVQSTLHGAFQGLMSEAQGGDFRSGFLGGLTAGITGGNIILSTIAGGTLSQLSGGKFADGAFAASLVVLYNDHQGEYSRQDFVNDAIDVTLIGLDVITVVSIVATFGADTPVALALRFGTRKLITTSFRKAALEMTAPKSAKSFFEGVKYSQKVLRQMQKRDFHNFPNSVEGFATKFGRASTRVGADGKSYEWLTMPGSYRGKTGVFEFIKNEAGVLEHRYFNVP